MYVNTNFPFLLSLTHPLTSFLFPPDKVLYTDLPLVLSAPTGSGKTVVFELAIVRLLQQTGQQISSVKIVYGEQCWSNIGITQSHTVGACSGSDEGSV